MAMQKKKKINLVKQKETILCLSKWETILNYAHGHVDKGEVKYFLIHVGAGRII